MPTSKVIQLVGRGDRNNLFDKEGMKNLIYFCDAPKVHYTVVSVIGPQSSGKSTLMNGIFDTGFTVMDESVGRGRTTQGIWASICNNPRAIVLDVEGTDGLDTQNDLGFETRSALFAMLISDVTFFNIWLHQVNLSTGHPLLTNVFQEIVKQQGLAQQGGKHLVFAVRNYNGKTPKKTIEEIVINRVFEIWDNIPQANNWKLERYFKLYVELFPDRDYKAPEFNKKCKDCIKEITGRISNSDCVDQEQTHLPVSDFALWANGIWDKIVKNQTLDIPSQSAMRSRASCENILNEMFRRFESSKEYSDLIKPGNDNPKEFDNKLKKILDRVLFDFDNETKVYGQYAAEIRETLKTKILHKVQTEKDKTEAEKDKTKAENALRTTKTVLIGVATASTAVVGAISIGPVAAAIGGTAFVATALTFGALAAVSTVAVAVITAVQDKNHEVTTEAAERASRKQHKQA